MPLGLRQHLRYPEDLFRLQATVYGTYHMTDPEVFYNREDQWTFPQVAANGRTTAMQPYDAIMRLPGEPREEFIDPDAADGTEQPRQHDRVARRPLSRSRVRHCDRVCRPEGQAPVRSRPGGPGLTRTPPSRSSSPSRTKRARA